jgi:hypothetical protein
MTTEITIGSDQDRPHVFAEVRFDGNVIADVIYDVAKESYQVTIYSGPDDEWVSLDLAEFRRALLRAKEALVARGFPDLTA